MRATRAIIYLEHLRANIRSIRAELHSGIKICMAVKADAYGHGAVPVSRIAQEEGVEALGVATVEEAVELRNAGIKLPLLLYGLPLPGELPEVVHHGVVSFLASREQALLLSQEAKKQGRRHEVHLKIDTGMGRIGCRPQQAPEIASFVAADPYLTLEGVCTHFPVADSEDRGFTVSQIAIFEGCIESIKRSGVDPGIVHAANSGAVVGYPRSYFGMVRPGIILYGYYPSREQNRRVRVRPVMEFATRVVFVKEVQEGTQLSYGLTYTAKTKTRVATLPVGYADGYNRLLSNVAEVAIRGRRYPVVGRICMDQCLVDLGLDSPVQLHDEVVLFGPAPPAPDAEEIAGLLNTIPYEVTCRVSRRVPRLYE
jgi:alanine racemase